MRRTPATLSALICATACAPAVGVGSAAADDPSPLAAPSLFTRPGEMLGQTLRFRGALGTDQAGRTLQIQRQQPDGSWMPTATAIVASDGSFVARWRTDAIGRFAVRALVAGSEAQAAAEAPLTTSVTIYRPARATWFGPGFYGKRTACGQVMSRDLLGVAHRKLPCGTPVAVFFNGKALTVPVVDRGPFGNGARYDLTAAAARTLGMAQTSTIGVVPQRGGQMPPPAAPAPSPYAATGGIAPTG
ncbi:MAG TPA: septal ring lytic transglycosylase RlpA family protein [Solirubrobacteraceae bacterium]